MGIIDLFRKRSTENGKQPVKSNNTLEKDLNPVTTNKNSLDHSKADEMDKSIGRNYENYNPNEITQYTDDLFPSDYINNMDDCNSSLDYGDQDFF